MRCPNCSADDTRVIDSRLGDGGATVRRRRECQKCRGRFTTFERLELKLPSVTKSDGRREPFDESKLRRGIERALEKRPVNSEQVELLVAAISQRISDLGEREVPSRLIGEAVMAGLRDLDEVAYVRFASVYRSFEDVSAFNDEIDRLRANRIEPAGNRQLSLLGKPRNSGSRRG